MILYDDKQNFLGMSSHTLGFLGYEDIGDFLSQHNDFANLFVNKEGFIYNFDNFNWIDFVLYSGAANKSAIITLKNGQDTKVDLSIKEVHLAHDLSGIKKLYSVKIISDHFHEISGVPKNEDSVGGVGGFSLSGLVEKEPIKEKAVELKSEKVDFQNLIIESTQQEDKDNESFILNVTEDKLASNEDIEAPKVEDKIVSNTQNDFKLDFLSSSTSSQEPEEKLDFILKKTEPESKELNSDFLLKSDALENTNTYENTLPNESKQTTNTFEFNLLKDEIKEDLQINDPSLDLDQSIVKTEESYSEVVEDFNLLSTQEGIKDVSEEMQTSTPKDNGFKLDFLKIDSSPVAEAEESVPIVADNQPNLNSSEHEEIIQQIKNDIKEIDTVDEDEVDQVLGTDQTQNETFILNIPKMPQVEQPLNIEQEDEQSSIPESLSSFQIQENKSLDINKSFTSTLKGLFGNKQGVNELKSDEETKDEAFNFNLKAHEDTEPKEVFESKEDQYINKDISFEHDTKVEEKELVQNNAPEVTFHSLSALGLSPDDEFDLLSDFISDVRESIETIEQFTQTKDFDKINYSLVKIKSSAEILNLNDIIDNANSIRKYCITEDSEKVITETNRLKENIGLLEKHLEATAI